MRNRVGHIAWQHAGLFVILWVALFFSATQAFADISLPQSNHIKLNLGATPWQYIKDVDDPVNFPLPSFDDSGWQTIGVPQTPADNDTFINTTSGGGQGFLTGNTNWYRKHFALDAALV
jgi:hypothetical protein